MFERKITSIFENWYHSNRKKALLIKGLRQVGKTYIVRDFCQKHYQNFIEINFKNDRTLKEAFDGDLSVDRLIMRISALKPNARFVPHKTIIFFDEIQECARARASIKPFVDDGRYDIIASGSLLGLRNYNKKLNQDVPVGYERIVPMHALDFEEFLWARGISKNIIAYLRKCFAEEKPVDVPIHKAMLSYFKEYLVVGGMPSIVDTFLENHDLNATINGQRDLIEEYKDDFGKHLDEKENEDIDRTLLARIEAVFSSLPSQLAKENQKFTYSGIATKAKGRDYDNAIQWLVDYGLAMKCFNLRKPELPLEGNKINESFKLFLSDSGLLVSLLEDGTAANILQGDLYVYKGAIFENAVADAIATKNEPLYYFRKDSGLEIDFVKQIDGKATLIEVKSVSGRTKAADEVLSHPDKYHVDSCIKLGEYNIGHGGTKLTIPYYMAFLL
ncbi:MAG: ATP-binding protein [Bacilli bacterium]|jgi:predicted AAA+ superfamily ATPase|nr:ATP-binding protein [Bacilli bacterium]MCI2111432.1 ATP-binding protein [Bacilli bacterium]